MNKQSPWNYHRIFAAPQKIPDGRGVLSSMKQALFVAHDCHTFHHTMTTETPQSSVQFPPNTPKNG